MLLLGLLLFLLGCLSGVALLLHPGMGRLLPQFPEGSLNRLLPEFAVVSAANFLPCRATGPPSGRCQRDAAFSHRHRPTGYWKLMKVTRGRMSLR